MTNLEIVANEVVTNNLLTEEQVEEMIIKFGALPYKTYQEWKYSGYQVKKGSKAIIKTSIFSFFILSHVNIIVFYKTFYMNF